MTARLRVLPGGRLVLQRYVVLGVDPGRVTGVAIVSDKAPYASGVVDGSDWAQRQQWIERAVIHAENVERPLVIAIERFTSHGRWGFDAAQGTIEQAGRWLGAVEQAAPRATVVRIEPMEWRRALFGGGQNRKRAVWKQVAQVRAWAKLGRRVGEDEAEALCIALWAQRAPVVAEAVQSSARSQA